MPLHRKGEGKLHPRTYAINRNATFGLQLSIVVVILVVGATYFWEALSLFGHQVVHYKKAWNPLLSSSSSQGEITSSIKEMKPDDLRQAVQSIIPPLTAHLHKGQCGKVAIIGGSFEYTGAPYYAGMSALKLGADLSHIICTKEAAIPIKSYSPELIVHPMLRTSASLRETQQNASTAAQNVISLLSRIDSLVIGPGLGRDQAVLDTVAEVIKEARNRDIPLVIDGDGLFLISQKPNLVKGYRNAVLTPNVVEYKRLCQALEVSQAPNSSSPQQESLPVKDLAERFGHITILQKGLVDNISDGAIVLNCDAKGSPRRCGGQGDVLAGTLGTFLSWTMKLDVPYPKTVLAAYGAAALTRRSAEMAFERHRRATTTPDLIASIGDAFEQLYPITDATPRL